MTRKYQLKHGNYHLYDRSTPASRITGEDRLRLKSDTIAIAFEASTGRLREHGSTMRIHSWAANARRGCGPWARWTRPMTSLWCLARCLWMKATSV